MIIRILIPTTNHRPTSDAQKRRRRLRYHRPDQWHARPERHTAHDGDRRASAHRLHSAQSAPSADHRPHCARHRHGKGRKQPDHCVDTVSNRRQPAGARTHRDRRRVDRRRRRRLDHRQSLSQHQHKHQQTHQTQQLRLQQQHAPEHKHGLAHYTTASRRLCTRHSRRSAHP